MQDLIQAVFNNSDEKTALFQLIGVLSTSGKRYFLRNEILHAFADYCQQYQKPAYFYHSSALGKLIHSTHEILLEDESIWLLVRPWIASQQLWRLTGDLSSFAPETVRGWLDARDRTVNRYQPHILELDFHPFYKGSPVIDDPRNIGQGLTFLNRYFCDKLLTERQFWLEALYSVLQRHQYDGVELMIGSSIHSGNELSQQVKVALKFLSTLPPDEPYEKFHPQLQQLGFEPGWGNNASRVLETFQLLNRLADNPEPAILEAFVSRIPAYFRIVLVSIHGWVAQDDVVGRSETMGQVVYVLNQARSLEHQLKEDIKLSGLDFFGIKPQVAILTRLIPNCEGTQCNLRLEKVEDTDNAWILRVPFREFNPKVTGSWISKFEIWPYLETLALDAETELIKQLGGRPNLIIGNYTDGNLVAFLLARRLKAINCNIAHSLEKTKYLFSDLYWQEMEERYHFSAQFTADLIGMNAADFIVTSSYQEIMGTPDTIGQYESYKSFTMPQLFHAIDGIDLFSPKFNVVPPGVNESYFFPYTERRDENLHAHVEELLFTRSDYRILGYLEEPKKRAILAIAPVTSIKNLTGLVECFAQNQKLRDLCNLILITGKLHLSEAANAEESGELEKLHYTIERYRLHGRIRWLGMRLSNAELGEAYRIIADYRGIFVHFARFEAFGLTILEAMFSGLPTFATQFGGSLEIIQDGENGFHINPTDLEGSGDKLVNFLSKCDVEPEYWEYISERGIKRVREGYNWRSHAAKMLLLAKVYGFWNYVSQENREALWRYLEALFFLLYKPRAENILQQHWHRW